MQRPERTASLGCAEIRRRRSTTDSGEGRDLHRRVLSSLEEDELVKQIEIDEVELERESTLLENTVEQVRMTLAISRNQRRKLRRD